MSDADNDKTQASSADGFSPAPPPPQLTEEEAGIVQEGESTNNESGNENISVSKDTANRALEAVQILVENNRSASQQLESLMTIVLDAAEVANRSASHVTTTGGQLNKAAEKLIDGAQRTSNQSKVVLALVAAVLVGCAATFSFIAVQLQAKVEQLDEMMLAVGKRAVDLKRRMESMDDINTQLTELNLKQESTQSVQQAIEDKIATIVDIAKGIPRKASESLEKTTPQPETVVPKPAEKVEKVPPAPKKIEASSADNAKKIEAAKAKAEAAKAEAARTEAANKALLEQLSGLDALLKEQSKSVRDLSGQVNNLQGAVSNVETVKKEVEGLAKLQQQQEQLRIQELAAANARREKETKDKERELARERDRLRERDAARDRELAKEREAARERELAKERELARERDKEVKSKDRSISYNREQSRPSGNASTDVPAYNKPSVAKPE
jgi:DNA repair exonuclease SbcCD ATPase subunit